MKKRELLYLAGGIFIGSLIARKISFLSIENALLREILKSAIVPK